MVYCFRVISMPRIARKKSISNIYHVMIRGINRQVIFEEDADRICFMKILDRCKEISGFRLYAFVLMPNHVHLLIEPACETLNTALTRIETRYAMWFNRKYERAGYLFQNRYRSEAVDTNQYFMTVLRYILHNPLKAGLESRPGSYRWSSYFAYERGKGAVTDTQYAIDLFGGRENLMEFLSMNNEDADKDEEDFDRRLREEQVREKMMQISRCATTAAFQQLDRPLQKEYAAQMYLSGVSLGQISKFTGMSKTTVFKAVKAMKDTDDEEKESVLSEPSLTEGYADSEIVW